MNMVDMTVTDALRLERLSKRFGKTEAVRDLDLTVPGGAFTVLLGPAGAGKTTTLRAIAGLEHPEAGRVVLRGEDVTGRETRARDVAMIFDSLALYPHKTGFGNIAHPLQVSGKPKAEIEAAVNAVAATLKIGHILNRKPKTMSGGERQRVALGRALVREPRIFLLDEPLSSLDAQLRIELRAELKRLQRERGYSILLATPDYTEAMAVADTVVMLIGGEARQTAPPQMIYDAPADRDVARFVGAPEINLLDARVDDGRLRFGELILDAAEDLRALAASRNIQIGLRPEWIAFEQPEGAAIRGEIVDIEPLGLHSAFTIRAGGVPLRVTARMSDAFVLHPGEPIGLRVEMERALAFDAETGRRIDRVS